MSKNLRKAFLTPWILMGIILLAGVTASCNNKPASESAQSQPAGPALEVSIQDFAAAYKADPKIHILDVRTPGEYQEHHVPGGVLIPLQDIMAQGDAIQSQIPFEKDAKIYVICRSGNRSFTATRILRSLGYTQAASVRGGHSAWIGMGNSCDTDLLACAN